MQRAQPFAASGSASGASMIMSIAPTCCCSPCALRVERLARLLELEDAAFELVARAMDAA